MGSTEEMKFLVDVAHLYYEKQLTQQQIARKLHVSRSLVSKVLVKARKSGVVEVLIKDDKIHAHKELEERMKGIFGLKEIICAEPMEGQTEEECTALQAGKYLARRLPNVKYAAVSGGRMARETAMKFTSPIPLEHVTFVPLCGGVDKELWDIQANTVCEYFASHCGASGLQLHAPIVVDSKEAKDIFMSQRFIEEVLQKAKQSDIAFVGIGTGSRYFEMTNLYLEKEQCMETEMKDKVKGDLIYNFYDLQGRLLDCPWNRQNMTLSLEDLQQIPEVIGAAYETEKAEAIYIAVRRKIISSLIVTAPLARQILKLHSRFL